MTCIHSLQHINALFTSYLSSYNAIWPILGPIQGILFGPIALLTIPIGNVIGGAVHDYFAGMICTRDGGAQMPEMVKKYTNGTVFWIYDAFVCLLLLLVGTVFIYTP